MKIFKNHQQKNNRFNNKFNKIKVIRIKIVVQRKIKELILVLENKYKIMMGNK